MQLKGIADLFLILINKWLRHYYLIILQQMRDRAIFGIGKSRGSHNRIAGRVNHTHRKRLPQRVFQADRSLSIDRRGVIRDFAIIFKILKKGKIILRKRLIF